MKSKQFLALTMLYSLSNVCTMGMEDNKLDPDYAKQVIDKISVDNIKNLPKALPDESYYVKDRNQREDYRILRHLSNYPSSSDLYSRIIKIIELQKSSFESNDEIAQLISELRSNIDSLIEKKLTNGKNSWNMHIVPRLGSKCIIPLNLYEFEKNNSERGFSKREKKDACLLYLEFNIPKNFNSSYLSGTIKLPSFKDINSKINVFVTLKGEKTIVLPGSIDGEITDGVLGWWNLRKIRNVMYS